MSHHRKRITVNDMLPLLSTQHEVEVIWQEGGKEHPEVLSAAGYVIVMLGDSEVTAIGCSDGRIRLTLAKQDGR